jgi:hypothetical protein
METELRTHLETELRAAGAAIDTAVAALQGIRRRIDEIKADLLSLFRGRTSAVVVSETEVAETTLDGIRKRLCKKLGALERLRQRCTDVQDELELLNVCMLGDTGALWIALNPDSYENDEDLMAKAIHVAVRFENEVARTLYKPLHATVASILAEITIDLEDGNRELRFAESELGQVQEEGQ